MPSIRDASLQMKEMAAVVKAHVTAAFAPLAARVKALEDRQPDRGEQGPQGPQGEPGRDASPVVVSDVAAELLKGDAFKALVDLQVAESMAEYFKANPPKDGNDGEPGHAGPPGPPGSPGKDGRGAAGAVIDRDGHLVLTMSDGTVERLGEVVGKSGAAGRDGTDGKDGLSFEHATGSFDAERGFVLTLTNGQRSAEFILPYMRHGGFWSEGKAAKAGESWTTDGALWIAKRDTSVKPCIENKEDWILAARKGRDGKDGRNGIDRTKPVKVDGSDA